MLLFLDYYETEPDQTICLVIKPIQIATFGISMLSLMIIFRSYAKRVELSATIISWLSCWIYLYTSNLPFIISYYWFDLVISILTKNPMMVVHHLFTLFGVQHCHTYDDMPEVLEILYIIKLSDIFIHHYKITHCLELERRYPTSIRIYQLGTTLITIGLWIGLRVVLVGSYMPFKTMKANVLIPIFIFMGLLWVIMLIKLAWRIGKKI